MNTVLNFDLPEPPGRLSIPVVSSDLKMEIQEENKNSLEKFLSERVYNIDGLYIIFDNFVNAFHLWLAGESPGEEYKWSKMYISRSFPRYEKILKGKYGKDNETVIANASLSQEKETDFIFKHSTKGRVKLVEKEEK